MLKMCKSQTNFDVSANFNEKVQKDAYLRSPTLIKTGESEEN